MGTKPFGIVTVGHSPDSSEAPPSVAFTAGTKKHMVTPNKAGPCVCETFPGTSATTRDGFEGRRKS